MKLFYHIYLGLTFLSFSCSASDADSHIWTEYSFILKPSSISGIGVFATHDIPAGTKFFRGEKTSIKCPLKDIPPAFRKYVVYVNDEECMRPERFDRMGVTWYLNHSDHPNTKRIEERWTAIRDIKADEEILIDYNDLDEPEAMKEDFYKVSH